MINDTRASLRIYSILTSAAQITEILGTAPDSSYEKGDLVSARGPKPIYRKGSMWIRKSVLERTRSLDEHLLELMGFLEEKKDLLSSLSDCQMDVHCGAFSDNERICLFLGQKAIKALARHPVDILIDAYPSFEDEVSISGDAENS